MSSSAFFHAQVASIMDVLSKRAVHEIIKLVDDGSAALREEISRRQRENETLKHKLLLLEGELKTARGCREGILDNSFNISLQVQVCDDLSENQRSKVLQGSDSATASDPSQRISTDAAIKDLDGNALNAFEIKDEPVAWPQDWTEPVLDGEHWLADDPKSSQSQPGQNISEESTSGAAATNSVEPQCIWSEALSSRSARVSVGEHGRTLERRGGRADEMVTHRHPRRSQRLEGKERGRASQVERKRNGGRLDKGLSGGLLDDVSGEEAFRLSSAREGSGTDASSDASAEVNNQWAIEGQEEFIPSVSGMTFQDSLELKTDEGQHGEEKGFNCSECGQDFTDSENLEKHLLTHSRERPFSCFRCNKSFPHLSSLQSHERTHSRQKPFVCPVCNKRFLSKGYLKIHQRIHTREKPFICDRCGKGFTQSSNLKTHQIIHVEVGCFSCTACDLRFDSVSLLKQHRRVHHDEKGLICKRCGKSFGSADSLQQHRLANHKEKLFTCSLCKKCFTAKSSLKTHQSVHTGEKPYTCGDCGKSFAHQHNLNTHQRVHTGEKPYSCTLCGRAFTQNHTLQSHLRIHALPGLKEQARYQCIGICS